MIRSSASSNTSAVRGDVEPLVTPRDGLANPSHHRGNRACREIRANGRPDQSLTYRGRIMMKILMLHGINHNMFGQRDPVQYGTTTLGEIDARLQGVRQGTRLRSDQFPDQRRKGNV